MDEEDKREMGAGRPQRCTRTVAVPLLGEPRIIEDCASLRKTASQDSAVKADRGGTQSKNKCRKSTLSKKCSETLGYLGGAAELVVEDGERAASGVFPWSHTCLLTPTMAPGSNSLQVSSYRLKQ